MSKQVFKILEVALAGTLNRLDLVNELFFFDDRLVIRLEAAVKEGLAEVSIISASNAEEKCL